MTIHETLSTLTPNLTQKLMMMKLMIVWKVTSGKLMKGEGQIEKYVACNHSKGSMSS